MLDWTGRLDERAPDRIKANLTDAGIRVGVGVATLSAMVLAILAHLDGMGTGASSLRQQSTFAVTEMKIER